MKPTLKNLREFTVYAGLRASIELVMWLGMLAALVPAGLAVGAWVSYDPNRPSNPWQLG